MDFKKEIEKLLKKHIKEPFQLQTPPKKEFGDYSLPCFKFSKTSEQLAKEIKPNKYILKIQPIGQYLNFFINESILAEETIKTILKQKSKYGSTNLGNKKKLIIEHTSINPNASPHVGRARCAFIGDSLSRLFRFQNYNVETHYYVNDIGKQIAMLVLAYKGKIIFNKLLEGYIKINKKIKSNPKLEQEIFGLLYKLEKGDKKIKQQFKKTVDICLKGQKEILSEIDITFDKFDYESKYLWNKDTEKILSKLQKTGKLFKDEFGRLVLDQKDYNLPMKTPVFVLTRKDKTSLYGLRDIAYNIEKLSKGENILVLGEDQKLYFLQIKAALNLIGYKSPKIVHFSFITIKGKAMSTRSGDVVLLEDFMKEATKKAMEEISSRKRIKPNSKLAKQIAYGAIKFSILRVSPEKNINFNLQEALSFEGESAPYIQYVYARINSILKKYKKSNVKPNYSLLNKTQEKELILELSKFQEILLKTSDILQPNLIANYILNLAQKFNEFYQTCRVINAENFKLKEARVNLIKATSQTIKNSLNLLGIETPNQM